ncbi:MAG: hypothetical protein VKK59_05190, partial [Vampirovibrionales bacterium]|nr:hypothetical protein [Vampirovibrionales bacterium]
MALGKVYPFKAKGSLTGRGWRWGRLACILAYAAVGLKFEALQASAFTLMMLFGLGYWAIIHHRRITSAYETRFHLLQALLLMVFSSVIFQIIEALGHTIVSGGLALGIHDGLLGSLNEMTAQLPAMARYTLIGFSALGTLNALRGKALALPWIG